jgi:hypothetical protein
VRGNFYASCESDRGDAQPKQLSAEQQNYDANQRTNDCNGKVHRRESILDGHCCKGVGAKRLSI